jgi:hypothetical protein
MRLITSHWFLFFIFNLLQRYRLKKKVDMPLGFFLGPSFVRLGIRMTGG